MEFAITVLKKPITRVRKDFSIPSFLRVSNHEWMLNCIRHLSFVYWDIRTLSSILLTVQQKLAGFVQWALAHQCVQHLQLSSQRLSRKSQKALLPMHKAGLKCLERNPSSLVLLQPMTGRSWYLSIAGSPLDGGRSEGRVFYCLLSFPTGWNSGSPRGRLAWQHTLSYFLLLCLWFWTSPVNQLPSNHGLTVCSGG